MAIAKNSLNIALLLGLGGCQYDIFNPAGPIAAAEKRLLIETTLAMLVVVVPVIVLTFVFAWRYRAGARPERYDANFHGSVPIEAIVWGVPLIIIIVLSVMQWRSTIALNPFQPLPGNNPTLRVQAVALDWKWLFIYPDQHIATVNELEIPTGTDVEFDITATGAMNVFFIPRLGTQIYAMAGMQSKDHLLASQPGSFRGLSANFSGDGFPEMRFTTIAVPPAQFAAWVKTIQTQPGNMNSATYATLKQPGTIAAPEAFGQADPNLFNAILSYGSTTKTPPVPNPAQAQQ